jgi:hypothetical protein
LRPARELQRCAAYFVWLWFILSGIFLCGIVVANRHDDQRWPLVFLGLAVMALPSLGPAAVLWPYRVGVDERGIWLRRFFRWDLWPREAFAGGAVRAGLTSESWVYPAKPWHGRRLSLKVLAESERGPLMKWIRQAWRPPTEQLPPEIKITYFRRHLELSGGGIVVSDEREGQTWRYPWTDVVLVRIKRYEHWRWDFCRLELQLANATQPEILSQSYKGNGRLWDGPDAEVVLACVQQYVDSARFEVTALAGPPRTQDEADRRLQDVDHSYRDGRKANRFILGMSWICFVVFFARAPRGPLSWDEYQWLVFGLIAFLFGLYNIAHWMMASEDRRKWKSQRSELTNWHAGQRSAAP